MQQFITAKPKNNPKVYQQWNLNRNRENFILICIKCEWNRTTWRNNKKNQIKDYLKVTQFTFLQLGKNDFQRYTLRWQNKLKQRWPAFQVDLVIYVNLHFSWKPKVMKTVNKGLRALRDNNKRILLKVKTYTYKVSKSSWILGLKGHVHFAWNFFERLGWTPQGIWALSADLRWMAAMSQEALLCLPESALAGSLSQPLQVGSPTVLWGMGIFTARPNTWPFVELLKPPHMSVPPLYIYICSQ